MKLPNIATVRKLVVALIGAIALAVAHGVLPHEVNDYVEIAGPFLVALGVYGVENEPVEK